MFAPPPTQRVRRRLHAPLGGRFPRRKRGRGSGAGAGAASPRSRAASPALRGSRWRSVGAPAHGRFAARVGARGTRVCRHLALSADIFSHPDDLITKGRLIVQWRPQGFQVHFCVKRRGGRAHHRPRDVCFSAACSRTEPSLLGGVELKNRWAANVFSLIRASCHLLSLSFPS